MMRADRLRLIACAILASMGVAGSAQPLASAAPASVRVTLVRASESTASREVLLVRVVAEGLVLGSYQGTLTFDPAAFVVDSTIAGRDGSRYVNAADAAKGTIRFAGFTPTAFAGTDAVRIVGRAVKPVAVANFAAVLDVAGDVEGKAVAKAGLVAASGVEK